MRNLTVAFLFCLASSIANAQAQLVQVRKPVVCTDLNSIVETLNDKDISEKPIFGGKDKDKHGYFVTLNSETGTWSMIEYVGDTACILGFGDKGAIYSLKTQESHRRD